MHSNVKILWRSGSRWKVDAETAHNELERIRSEHGGDLKPEAVVKRARSKKSPLHNEFQWNDAEAAYAYRCRQARNLIADIRVVYTEAPMIETRAFEVIQATESKEAPARNVYRSTKEILADPIARDELLARAIREALAFRKRYNGLQELAKIFTALDDFLKNSEVDIKKHKST